jgi:HTH-type transcriptional regulator/antitoxin HigA
METEQNIIGLSSDFIIHPGETLAEVLKDRKMSQKELAIKTEMTEKYISTVISGQENISSSFANKLEYALGIKTEFWMNLQANYEREKKDVRENI